MPSCGRYTSVKTFADWFEGERMGYRAICFDLDGTLLPMDIDEFMTAYFKRIAAYAAARGLDPELFLAALKAGTRAMAMNAGEQLNAEAFWNEFARVYGEDNMAAAGHDIASVRAMADDFYENDFGHIGDGFRPNPAAARAVATLRAKGYPLVLTTMPMFPVVAVRHRLRWAGVDPDDFARITSYENSRSTKPRQLYYAENLAAMGVNGEDVLMVGNNTMEDLAFMDLGADAWLVTDWLLDPLDFDVASVKHGSFDELAAWCEGLPDCADPAPSIEAGPVDAAAAERALTENAVRAIDAADVEAKAQVLADAIASDHVPGSAARIKA